MVKKSIANLLALFIISLVLVGTIIGCTTDIPSDGDIEEAILAYLTRSALALTESPCRNPEAVKVIEVEQSSEKHKMTIWTATINIICPNKEVQAKYVVFKDSFGDIKVLKRTV
jgi:hypothetical protein